MLIILESIAMCFLLLIICVVGIANGPVGSVYFYEQKVQEKVVELGLTTKEKIKKGYTVAGIDRLFIDWYWVGKTKAWYIPGTEELMPYIPKKTLIKKWIGTVIGYPLLAAILSGVMSLM